MQKVRIKDQKERPMILVRNTSQAELDEFRDQAIAKWNRVYTLIAQAMYTFTTDSTEYPVSYEG